MANRGKTGQVDAVKRSRNWGYYCNHYTISTKKKIITRKTYTILLIKFYIPKHIFAISQVVVAWLFAFITMPLYSISAFKQNTYFSRKMVAVFSGNHICILFFYSYIISRLFQKWCNSGVVSAFSHCKIIDFIGFSGTSQDIVVADEKYRNHVYFPFWSVLICRVLALFAEFDFFV